MNNLKDIILEKLVITDEIYKLEAYGKFMEYNR